MENNNLMQLCVQKVSQQSNKSNYFGLYFFFANFERVHLSNLLLHYHLWLVFDSSNLAKC